MSFISGSPVLESTTNSNSPTARELESASEHNLNSGPARTFASPNGLDTQTEASSTTATDRFAEVAAVARLSIESQSAAEARSRTVLHEFQSLLEAAQRIADSAESQSSRDTRPSDQSDPIIRRATTVPRQAQAHEGRLRVPLTRQYSGRPHVPGEDSGSEHEDNDETNGEEEENNLFNQLTYSRPNRTDLDSLFDEQPSHSFVSENLSRMDRSRAQTAVYRARDSQSSIAEQMERDRESLRQAVAMTRELRRYRQSNTAAQVAGSSDLRLLGNDLSSSSVRSRAHAQPNLPTTTTSTMAHARPRSRSNSVRRWRPSERLQDYASSHTRRSSRDDHTSSAHSAVSATTIGAWRSQAEGNSHPVRTVGSQTQARDVLSPSGSNTEESRPWSTSLDRQTHSWMNNGWTPDFGGRSSRVEQNEHDEIVSRVERALQEYRLSRRNLRANQEESSSYLGSRATLAELSAARASRRQTSTSFSPDLPTPFSWEDRWRRDDTARRRNAEQTREHRRRYLYRLQSTLEGMQESERNTSELLASLPQDASESMKAAKASLKYLASMREPEVDSAKVWTTAAELGLHNKSLHETPNHNLPSSINDLPAPCVCSWLEPGMTWSGTQSADEDESPPRPVIETTYEDQARQRNIMNMLDFSNGNTTSRSDRHDPWQDSANPFSSYLTRLEQPQGDVSVRRGLRCPKIEPARAKDHWEVKAVLHSVDWEDMTLTGTMTASQIRGFSEPENAQISQDNGASMDSFFTGEIIDFLHFGLDTPSSAERETWGQNSSYRDKRQQNDWKVGGPEADLVHWASLGPFKEEVDLAIERRRRSYDKVLQKLNASLQDLDATRAEQDDTASDTTTTDAEPQPPTYTDSELNELKLDTMQRVLTNKKWLNEHINNEGWVLMRWKERCFVSPGTGPNPEPTRPWIPSRAPAARYDVSSRIDFPSDHLSRQNAQRIYSTNDAEREELNGSGSGRFDGGNVGTGRFTQPTWGLTISGFYYVALHRRTGRIEALYYDCSSAPYQRLRMDPAVCVRNDKSESMALEVPGGLRSSFNLVEFR